MTALTDEQVVHAIMSLLDTKDDADLEAFALTGDGGVRDMTSSYTANSVGNYDGTDVDADWTNEQKATWALITIRSLLLGEWRAGRKKLELWSAVGTAQTVIDALTLGTEETPPS